MFGFHDALDGVTPNTALSYLVVGWYSNPAKDILQGYDPKSWVGHVRRRLRASRIRRERFATERSTISNGNETAETEKRTRPSDLRFTKDDCTVAIGNTSSEALAALLAKKLDKPSLEPPLSVHRRRITDDDRLQGNGGAVATILLCLFRRGTQFSIQRTEPHWDPPAPATDATLPRRWNRR